MAVRQVPPNPEPPKPDKDEVTYTLGGTATYREQLMQTEEDADER